MTDQETTEPREDEWQGMTPTDRGFTTPMVDDAFTALSDWRRRAVCLYFTERETDSATATELASGVAEYAAASSVEDGTEQSAIRSELVTTHLPALHELGLLDFDERSETVRYWGSPTVEKWANHADTVTDRTEF